jgi:hypothetical protein
MDVRRLELDAWRNRDGVVATDDWDEFQAACTADQISSHEAIQATAATVEIEETPQATT